MNAELVMIGTELLLGEIVDTNANFLAKALREIGLDLFYKTTVGDNEQRITEVLNLALDRSDVVITSGGIGPTVDDVTRQAAAKATGRRLVFSQELERQIADRFRSFGRPMAENNRRQAYLPEGALPLENPVGTAPCFLSEDTRGRGCIVVLPGVPRELAYMMEHGVVPLLVHRMGGRMVTRVRILRTCAVGESNVDRAIGDLMSGHNPTVGLAAHIGQTDVRIVAKAATEMDADALIRPMEDELRNRLGSAVYGVDKETVASILGTLLLGRQWPLGILDTLTGGAVSGELRDQGMGEVVVSDYCPTGVSEASESLGIPTSGLDPQTLGAALARKIAPEQGVGLALIGPFEEGTTVLAVFTPMGQRVISGRRFRPEDPISRWLVIQALDLVRRTVLDLEESPV